MANEYKVQLPDEKLLADELIRSQTMLETQLASGGSLMTEENQKTINLMNNYQENITRKRLLFSANCI